MASPPPPLPPDVLASLERRQPLEALRLLLGGRGVTARAEARRAETPASASLGPKPAPGPGHVTPAFDSALSPGEVPRSRSTVWGWIVFVLLLVLTVRLLRM